MALKAFCFEQLIEAGEDKLRLVLDFAALDAIEGLIGRPFDEIIAGVTAGTTGSAMQAKIVYGLLRRHHPEATLDEAASLVFGPVSAVVGLAIGKLIEAAFFADTTEKKPRPRKPRGASGTS